MDPTLLKPWEYELLFVWWFYSYYLFSLTKPLAHDTPWLNTFLKAIDDI